MQAKKELGQNFLVDEGVVGDLTAAAQIEKTDTILEVGAGTGTVTRELAARAGKVNAGLWAPAVSELAAGDPPEPWLPLSFSGPAGGESGRLTSRRADPAPEPIGGRARAR